MGYPPRRQGLDGLFDDIDHAVGGATGNIRTCPCGRGGVIEWVPQYAQWYCRTCSQYIKPAQLQQVLPQSPVCPRCSQPALFFSQYYQRWYCNSCKQYSDSPSTAGAAAAVPSGPPVGSPMAAHGGAGPGGVAQQSAQTGTIIEDLFLLYNDGRLIRHHTRRLKPHMDSDILTGMLSAIQDFVRQTIATDDDSTLEQIHVGRNKIFLRRGRYLSIAAMVDGEDVEGISGQLQRFVTEVERDHEGVLKDWQGDIASLKPLNEPLQRLLTTGFQG